MVDTLFALLLSFVPMLMTTMSAAGRLLKSQGSGLSTPLQVSRTFTERNILRNNSPPYITDAR